MNKLRDKMKRIGVGFLAVAVAVSGIQMSRTDVQAAAPEFDASNVVLKVGVLSDPHFSYTDEDANTASRVNKYKNAVTYLSNRAGGELDMLMLAGDYTGTGSEKQAEIFAETVKDSLDSINVDKEEKDKTQFIFAYGNHDTDWSGNMDYAGWETVLNRYGVLDNVEKGPDGCYKAKVTKGGKTYYFYSLETYTYNNPCNMFLEEALDWLDEELNTVTTNAPDSYVYVVSHGPIEETGVYGSDLYFDKNASWGVAASGHTGVASDGRATSSDVNGVLKKYPQVVYFSGHTHFTNLLESTIMQKDYTAITVSSLNGGDLFSSVSGYAEDNYAASRPAYGMLVEVDGNGNQRITRINVDNNSICGEPWVMSAPNAEKTHLLAYTQAARQKTPTFASDAKLAVSNIAYTENKDQLSFDISFDAAECDNYIIRYELVLYNQNGKEIASRWMVGNWTDHTTGVAAGTNHFDATKFAYSFTLDSTELVGVTGFYAKLYAIDEFGGKSAPLAWKSENDLQAAELLKPVGKEANKNMFDGLTADRVFMPSQAENVTNVFDAQGNLTTDVKLYSVTDSPWTSIRYVVSKDKYDAARQNGKTTTYYGNWAASGTYPEQYTDLEASDTYVYETDFTVSSCNAGSELYFQIRTPDMGSGAAAYKSDYSGIRITTEGTSLYAYKELIGQTSDVFKLSADNAKHHLIAVTSADKISVWIDDVLIFDNADFVPDLAAEAFNGALASDTMLPTMALYVVGIDVSVSNQYLYLYDPQEQLRDEMDPLTMRSPVVFEGAAGGYNSAYVSFDAATKTYTTNAKDSTSVQWWTKQFLNGEFKNNDTVITEFEYTPTNLVYSGTGWDTLCSVWVTFRYANNGSCPIKLLLRTNGPQNILHIADDSHLCHMETTTNHVVNSQTVKVKIVSDNEKASVYLDGVCVLKDKKYTDVNPNVDVTNAPPILQFGVQNMDCTVSNISVRKADTTIPGVTSLTDENNLLKGQFADIYSNVDHSTYWAAKPDSVIKGTNIYSDMTYNTLTAAGFPADNCWSGELFSFFGSSNSNLNIASNEGYVLSTLARVANTKEQNNGYTSRLSVTVAKYNGTNAWYFIDDTKLTVYTTQPVATVDLAAEIGYAVGDYLRLTTVVSPYGYDIYANGILCYSFDGGDGSNVDYSVMNLGCYGAQIRLLDTSIHYNKDNGQLYKEKLLKETESFSTSRKGIWYEDKTVFEAEIARIKAACESLTTTSNETLKGYVGAVSRMVASGKVTNNMVWDGSTSVKETSAIDLDGTTNTNWSYGYINFFNSGCKFKRGDTWVFEADVECVTGWMNRRLGFGLGTDVNNPEIMVQNANPHYWGTTWHSVTTISQDWNTGRNWHVKFVVKPFESVQAVYVNNVDGTELWNKTFAWSELGKTSSATENTVFYPRLNFACVDATISNIYVGYDVTNDVSALSAAAAEAKNVATEGYTPTSVNAFKEAVANAETIANACTDAFTNPYSKAEINAAEAAIGAAQTALVAPTAYLTIGGGDTDTNEVRYGVASGETLPTGHVEDKYVISWTVNGEAVTAYNASVDTAKYVADFIDTDMLKVAWQQSTKEENSTVYRFIASVNDVDKYRAVGFEFSLDNSKWYKLGDMTVVYEQIKEGTGVKTAGELYGTYSKYLFVQPLDFGSYTKVYVRAYVILDNGGTVVYGATSLKDTAAYGAN